MGLPLNFLQTMPCARDSVSVSLHSRCLQDNRESRRNWHSVQVKQACCPVKDADGKRCQGVVAQIPEGCSKSRSTTTRCGPQRVVQSSVNSEGLDDTLSRTHSSHQLLPTTPLALRVAQVAAQRTVSSGSSTSRRCRRTAMPRRSRSSTCVRCSAKSPRIPTISTQGSNDPPSQHHKCCTTHRLSRLVSASKMPAGSDMRGLPDKNLEVCSKRPQ